MEYRFERTVHGPAVVSDDEVVFFFQYAQLQDYMDSDPEFFNKAYTFCQETIREYGEMLARAVFEDVVGVDQANTITTYFTMVDHLRRFEHDRRMQAFPGPNPQF